MTTRQSSASVVVKRQFLNTELAVPKFPRLKASQRPESSGSALKITGLRA